MCFSNVCFPHRKPFLVSWLKGYLYNDRSAGPNEYLQQCPHAFSTYCPSVFLKWLCRQSMRGCNTELYQRRGPYMLCDWQLYCVHSKCGGQEQLTIWQIGGTASISSDTDIKKCSTYVVLIWVSTGHFQVHFCREPWEWVKNNLFLIENMFNRHFNNLRSCVGNSKVNVQEDVITWWALLPVAHPPVPMGQLQGHQPGPPFTNVLLL